MPGPAVWREVYRVLKPGGYLLCFAGSRTYGLMEVAIRLAGFEIRDQMQWLYGSGFPKSLDVSKAIDKRGGVIAPFEDFKLAVREALRAKNLKRKDLQQALGNHMLSHYLTDGAQPAVPSWRDYQIIRDFVGLGDTFDALFAPAAEREIVGRDGSWSDRAWFGGQDEWDITTSSTDAAKQWEGWGTALKPAHEPIVVARKPLGEKTVAANVLTHGTGAINIDGCRVGSEPSPSVERRRGKPAGSPGKYGATIVNRISPERFAEQRAGEAEGRWPANVILDEEAAKLLDEQSGERKVGGAGRCVAGAFRFDVAEESGVGGVNTADNHYGDSGGASRFFYTAKASKRERNAGLPEGMTNNHPTVKPIELMRYLIRLVCPPGGTVLDPFLGSGTTGCAAALEPYVGSFIACELGADYIEIAKARIAHWQRVSGQGPVEVIACESADPAEAA